MSDTECKSTCYDFNIEREKNSTWVRTAADCFITLGQDIPWKIVLYDLYTVCFYLIMYL